MIARKSTTRTFRVSLSLVAALAAIALVAVAEEPPTKADESSAALGRATFRSYCASCHGAEAKGDGTVAEYLTVRPADLTHIATRNEGEFPYEKVVQIIDGRKKVSGHGSPDMPVWGDAFQLTPGGETPEGVQNKIEQLAHFLWTIQEK